MLRCSILHRHLHQGHGVVKAVRGLVLGFKGLPGLGVRGGLVASGGLRLFASRQTWYRLGECRGSPISGVGGEWFGRVIRGGGQVLGNPRV